MKKIILVFLGWVLVFSFSMGIVSAQKVEISKETKELCNDVMLNIYYDVMEVKRQYRELKDFSRSDLSYNSFGIYTIDYLFENPNVKLRKRSVALDFGITIVPIDTRNSFEDPSAIFEYVFPLLGVKFIGHQKARTHRKTFFNILTHLQKHKTELLMSQQKFMPFQLSVTSAKEYFHVGEKIGFTVSLKNMVDQNLKVKELNGNTLSLVYDNKTWGKQDVSGAKNIVLSPGKSINKIFTINGVHEPREFQVYCSYAMTFKGASPVAVLTIKVKNKK